MRSTETKSNTLEDLLQGHVRCMPWRRETRNRLDGVCKLCFILSQVTCSFSVNTWAKEANINFDPPCLLLSCFFHSFPLDSLHSFASAPHPKQCPSAGTAVMPSEDGIMFSSFQALLTAMLSETGMSTDLLLNVCPALPEALRNRRSVTGIPDNQAGGP